MSDEKISNVGGMLDARTSVLVTLAALVVLDASEVSYIDSVSAALDVGVTQHEIIATLSAVVPIAGRERVATAASKVGQALGLDVSGRIQSEPWLDQNSRL